MYFGVYLLGLVWDIVRRRTGSARSPIAFDSTERHATLSWLRQHTWIAIAAAAGILGLFTAQILTVAFMAHHQIAPACWRRLPLPVVADLGEDNGGPAQFLPSLAIVAIAAAQSALLALIFFVYRKRPFDPVFAAVAACVCVVGAIEAIFAPAMTSGDVYTYLVYSRLGFAAFQSQPQIAVLQGLPTLDWCMHRVMPSAYGPAFIAYAKLFASTSTPISQISVFRTANAVWFLALLGLLRAARIPWLLVTLAAVNPFFWFQSIVNPHNDIIGTVFVVAALALAPFSAALAAILVVIAALVKLSFALIGVFVFVQRSATRRFTFAALSFAAAIALSFAWAGPHYFESITFYDRLLAPDADPLQYGVLAVAVWATFSAVFLGRYRQVYTYTLPALRIQTFFPWYAIWSLPYAIRERTHLAAFLILLPVMALLMETGIAKGAQLIAYATVVVAITLGMLRDISAARTEVPKQLDKP
jgi:hypothetical protein